MNQPDVPTEVYAALRASADAVPVGPPPEHGRQVWWERHALAEEVAQQAYERLHAWAVEEELHPAVVAAIGDAAEMRRRTALECRRDAGRARDAR